MAQVNIREEIIHGDYLKMLMKEYTKFRAFAGIDLGILRENMINIIKAIPSGATPVGVIKADAYGHGALPAAKATEDIVSAFAVATPDEAFELREGGIMKPVYILGYSHPSAYSEIIARDIQPAIFKLSDARELSENAVRLGKTVKINIKVDTGMGRIGFPCSAEAARTVCEAASLPGIETDGLFMHFATADCEDKSYASLQFSRFNSFISACGALGLTFSHITCANSAAILEMPYTAKTQMRAGILLYGYYPSEEVRKAVSVKPVMSLHSHIVQIKTIEAGDSIGYGRTFIADREMRIATIPVGYADGYPRALSNKGRVIVKGCYARIVGRICMDMFMVDVTAVPEAAEGDEVLLMGTDGGLTVDADEIAALTGTISYEILCDIGKRVPRIYNGNTDAKADK